MPKVNPEDIQRVRSMTLVGLYTTLVLLSLMLLFAAASFGPSLEGPGAPYMWAAIPAAIVSFGRTALAAKRELMSLLKKADRPRLDLMAFTLALLAIYLASRLFEGY